MKTDRDRLGLRGSVESVLVETAQLEQRDGQVIERSPFQYEWSFNPDGWFIQQTNRNPDGSEWRTVYDYSDCGKLLATKVYESSGAIVSEVRYVYDDEERLIAEQVVDRERNVTTPTTYLYDTSGRRTKVQELTAPSGATLMVPTEGTSTFITADEAKTIETHYDERGEAVEVKVFNAAGSIVRRVEITRDERGNPLEETHYHGDVLNFRACGSDSCATDPRESLTEEQKAEFDAAVAQLFAPNSALSRHTHTYDVVGRLVESKMTMMGMIASHQTFAYDDAGNKSEEASYNEDGSLANKAILTREYDEHGNWTQELVSTASTWDAEFGLSTPTQVTRRTITYYP